MSLRRTLIICLLAMPLMASRCEYLSEPYFEELAGRLDDQSGPDVGYIESMHAQELIASGTVRPVDELVAPSEFDPLAIEAFRGGDGRLYGVPRDMQTVVLLYDRDILSANGFETPPGNWDELAETAAAISASGEIAGLALTGEFWNWLPFLFQSGGELVAEGEARLDSDEARVALDFYVGLVLDGAAIVPPVGLEPTDESFPYGSHTEAVQMLGSGDVAMVLAPNNALEFAINEGLDNIAAAVLPQGPAGPATIAYVTGLAAYRDLGPGAAAFLRRGTSPEAQSLWSESLQFMPTRPALYDDYIDRHPGARAFVEATGHARHWQPPQVSFENLKSFDRLSREPLAAALRGEVPADDALADLQSLAEQLLVG